MELKKTNPGVQMELKSMQYEMGPGIQYLVKEYQPLKRYPQ